MSKVVTKSYVERSKIISSWVSKANLQEAAKAILIKFNEIANMTDDQLDEYRKELNTKFVPKSYNKSGANARHRLFDANDIGSRKDRFMKGSSSSFNLEQLRKELKPENSAVWKNTSADVKRSMLKIKVYDEYLQLFNDELAVNEDKKLSNALISIRELVGYHLDTNNFWITWKEQENIVMERLTALANNKIIGKEKSWFGLFSNYDFIDIPEGAKCFFDNINVVLERDTFSAHSLPVEAYLEQVGQRFSTKIVFERNDCSFLTSPLKAYQELLSKKTLEEPREILTSQRNSIAQHDLVPELITAHESYSTYSKIIKEVGTKLTEYLPKNSAISSYHQHHGAFLNNLSVEFNRIPELKRINLYNSNELGVFINSELRLVLIIRSLGNDSKTKKVQLNLTNVEKFNKFCEYLFKAFFSVQLLNALTSIVVNSSISNQLANKYSNLINSPTLFDQNTEYYDQIWMEILVELLPKNADAQGNEQAKELLTKETFLLDFVINMLERNLASSAYNEVAEFNRFIQYLKSPEKVSLEEAEIRILTWLARSFLAPDMQDVKHPEEEVKNLKTEINNLLDSKAET